jgi:hypothetical protein
MADLLMSFHIDQFLSDEDLALALLNASNG